MLNRMMKSIAIVSVVVFSSQVSAMKVIKLNPKESKQFTNHYVWTVNANCNLQTTNAGSRLKVLVMNHSGKVNGRSLSQGQATSFKVRDNENITVSAEPGTEVNLLNTGSGIIQASCSV